MSTAFVSGVRPPLARRHRPRLRQRRPRRGDQRHRHRRHRPAADRPPGPGLRLPGRRPRLRHRAVPGTRPRPLGGRAPRRRQRRHRRARRAAGRLLPVPGLPERHRHDRPRLLAVAHRAHRHHDAADRRSTARARSPRPVPNDPAHRLRTPGRRRRAGRVPGRVELARPRGAGGPQPHPGRRRVTAAARDRRRAAAAARQPAHRRLPGARSWCTSSPRSSTPSSAPSSSPPGCAAATRTGTAGPAGSWSGPAWPSPLSGLWMTLFYPGAPGGDLLWGSGSWSAPRWPPASSWGSPRSAAATSPRTAPG